MKYVEERADQAAAHVAAGDFARAQVLPETSTDALLVLTRARLIARPATDCSSCSLATTPASMRSPWRAE
jgi:hypothetical protein